MKDKINKGLKMKDKKGTKGVAYTKASTLDNDVKIILSKEVEDRDGEILSIKGCNLDDYKKNPVVLWGHRMTTGDVEDVMGKMVSIEKSISEDGFPILEGTVKFADHPKAQYLQRMVKQGIVSTVSVGFGIKEYDYDENTVTDWELYELSFVNVPANTEAMVTEKSVKESDDEFNDKVYKKLSNYEVIHPMIKTYRKLFLKDKEVLEQLGIEKSGSELVDVKNIHEAIKTLINKTKEVEVEETPQPVEDKQEENLPVVEKPEETPVDEGQLPATKEDIKEFLNSLGIER